MKDITISGYVLKAHGDSALKMCHTKCETIYECQHSVALLRRSLIGVS